MSTTIHEIAPEEIMAHRDGELSDERAQQVSAHLATCAECRDLVESLRSTSQSLATWNANDAPPSLQPRAVNSFSQFAALEADASSFSWQLFRNRRVLLGLGLLASTSWFVYIEIHNTKHPQMTAELRDAARVDINDYIPPRGKNASAGGGGGGDEPSTALADKAPPLVSALPRSSPTRAIDENGEVPTDAPMIARTAELQIVTPEFNAARANVDSILTRHRGYAASLTVSDAQSNARTLNASLRIPSYELPAALGELKSLGHVTSESQAGEEVTAEHADLVARLKNSRETETRLQDILRNRTGKVSDVLEVEQEIARVRGEVEQMESQRKTLEHRVDFANVNLTITEEYKAKVSDGTPAVATRFHNAAVTGLRNVTDSALALALWFAEYIPLIIFWLVLLGGPAWWLWRRTQRALTSTV